MSLDKPATLDEIAKVMGKTKRSIEVAANKGGWKYAEEHMSGKNKRRLLALADLPKDIHEAVKIARIEAALASVSPGDTNALQVTTQEQNAAISVSTKTTMALIKPEIGSEHASQEQRKAEQCIKTLMRFIDEYPGKKLAAIRYLNTAYADKTLSSPLVYALENSRFKSSGNAKTDAVLSRSTVDKWAARFNKTGSYLPKVRQPDMTILSWHVELVGMLANNRSGVTLAAMHRDLEGKYKDVSYDMVFDWVNKKYHRMDKIKGRHTGMALRAKQAYRKRTSAGMLPWDEVHADGWATHFTAPHPRTGEYVTFEVWDFHDVATRYVPPFSIGQSECFEVIAKGIENAIRDNGVMAILQTDSTKIVKNNAKFTGDPIRSISDLLGISIVHPVAVGNAQANGIAENFHAWLDKESRELATYQGKSMDSNTFRIVGKLTAKMVKAAAKGETGQYRLLKTEAEKVGGGIVFESTEEAVAWLESKRQKWNNKPHSALKKVFDEKTKKMRHQTPQDALDEHKANGWQPYKVDESLLVDIFRPTVKLKVRRGMIKPYGSVFFRHTDLDAYEGESVIVSYEHTDNSQVWVRTLNGSLICVAPLWEESPYRSQTAKEAADEKRAVAQIRLREKKIDAIKQRAGMDDNGQIIEGESRKVIEFDLLEITPRLQTIEGLFETVPVESKKLSHEETMMLLWGECDDDLGDNAEKNKPVSL